MQIQLQKVAATFIEKEKVLQSQIWNCDIVFNQPQKIQIVAPSGSGKTSFINFLYGLRKDYTGPILYNEDSINNWSSTQLAQYRQQNISIVFQDLRLFAEQSGLQNIEIKRLLNPYHAQSKILEMAHQLGIKNKLHQPCKTCSYGEQQRIAIIRALQQPFNFLLLDEPFSHLDKRNKKIALQLIEEEAAHRNASIILADLEVVENFKADKVLYL